MYLSWDSEIYTSEGWITIDELFEKYGGSQDLVVACYDMIGRLYWSFTHLDISTRILDGRDSGSRHRYRAYTGYGDAKGLMMVNGLINTGNPRDIDYSQDESPSIGEWRPAEEGMKGVMIDFDQDGKPIIQPRVVLPIGDYHKITDYALIEGSDGSTRNKTLTLAEVRGLPLGVIIDGLSIYPSNIHEDDRNPQVQVLQVRKRTNIYPFIPIGTELSQREEELMPGYDPLMDESQSRDDNKIRYSEVVDRFLEESEYNQDDSEHYDEYHDDEQRDDETYYDSEHDDSEYHDDDVELTYREYHYNDVGERIDDNEPGEYDDGTLYDQVGLSDSEGADYNDYRQYDLD